MRSRPAPRHLLVLVVALVAAAFPMLPSAAATVSISGAVFEDDDRDGVRDVGEAGWGDIAIHLFDAETGESAGGTGTDSDGTYVFAGLPAGSYEVRIASPWWREFRDEWAPTTTDGVWPVQQVDADADTRVDFGWRPITRSTSLSEPLSVVAGDDGLRVESFTDAVTAAEIERTLRAGGLIGDEAPLTTVRFGYSDRSSCGTSVGGSAGNFANFSATCYVSYGSWLDQHDKTLFHEYGHAWSLYHAFIVQQDDTLSAYLDARGLSGDDRLGTSRAWSPREMIAEDYRQLFGTPTAAAVPQENREIAPAAAVPGLATFLAETFTAPPGDGSEATEPSPSPEPVDAAPSVAVTTPADGDTVAGLVAVAVDARDDIDAPGGLDVEVWAAGTWRAAQWDDSTGWHVVELDTTSLPDGPLELRARSRDSAGNLTESASVDVTVDNPDPEPVVVALEAGGVRGKGGMWLLHTTAEVRKDGAPAADVRVVLAWSSTGRHSESGTSVCTTGADGTCTASAEVPNRVDHASVSVASPEPGPSIGSVFVASP